MSNNESLCPFCLESLNGADFAKLYSKGAESINEIIRLRGINIPEVVVGQMIHKLCRKNFCRKSDKEPESVATSQICSENTLDGIRFFCGTAAKYEDNGKRQMEMGMVKTEKFIENIAANIKKRDDGWEQQVKNRIGEKELMNASYHKNCNINFQNCKNIPLCHGVSAAKKVGRPQIKSRLDAFSKIVELVESENVLVFSIKELAQIMQIECSDSDEIIKNRHIKKSSSNIMVKVCL